MERREEAEIGTETAEMSLDDLDRVAGGDGQVTVSPNVLRAFGEINEKGALDFDIRGAARNAPMGDLPPGYEVPLPGYWGPTH